MGKGEIDGIWGECEERIREALKIVEREGCKGVVKKRGWWDEECVERKGEVRRSLRAWRKGVGKVEEYRKRRKIYKDFCERKKREENDRWER